MDPDPPPSTADASSVPVPGLETGRKLFNRYVLKRPLGRGGMGVVWLARDEKLEQDVALKFLAESMLHQPGAIERLKRETRHSLKLTHPNILRIHDFVEHDGFAAIAMEYVDGWSLWAMTVDRSNRCFSVDEVAPWLRQICAALDYAHSEAKVIHRDLKPSNILVDARNQIKIADFGIAHRVSGAPATTASGVAVGTLEYMSPQQAMGEDPSFSDDIYSLGATLYELLTGTPPFYKGEILAQIRELDPPSMTERLNERGIHDASIPLEWEHAVAACLAKDPSRRPGSAGELMSRLDSPLPLQTSPTSFEERPAKVPRKIVLAISLVVGVAALSFGLWTWRAELVGMLKRRTVAPEEASRPSPGSLDTSFDPGEGANDDLRHVAVVNAGKIVLAGHFEQYNGVARSGIVQLNPDGTVDTGFTAQTRGRVLALTVQNDAKVVIAGDFDAIGDVDIRTVARLNPDGSVDRRFNPAAGANKDIRAVAVQPNGKIIIGGYFTKYKSTSVSRLARLNPDGSRDGSFACNANDVVWAIATQPDGKVVIGGSFTFAGQTSSRVTRLNADGSFDPEFRLGDGPDNTVYAIALQNDGKILVGGDFTSVNEVPHPRLIRLNGDGTVDTSFAVKALDGGIRAIAVQRSDGKILIGGAFTIVNGVLRSHVARLNSDGTIDTSFDAASGPNAVVRSITIQNDGKIIIAGAFSEVNGVKRMRVARLHQ